ncbi:MAG: NAD-glutamate dehydrogenase [Deinococcales bacterium]
MTLTPLKAFHQRLEESRLETQRKLALRQLGEILFKKASLDFFAESDGDRLFALGSSALDFITTRPPQGYKLRLYNPDIRIDGWQSPYTLLECLLVDRPFIIDSLSNVLESENIKRYHLLHPIIKVQRDEAGNFIRFGENLTESVVESYELYFLERLSDKTIAELQGRLEAVLQDVIHATNDYQPMRNILFGLESQLRQGETPIEPEKAQEYADFLRWLDEGNFVFLGYREYDILEVAGQSCLQMTPDSGLGILRDISTSGYAKPVPIQALPENLRERVLSGKDFIVTKANTKATVHRNVRMDYIGLKKYPDNSPTAKVIGEQRFMGLFTYKALHTDRDRIPILGSKLAAVLAQDGSPKDSHDYKEIISIFNNMPLTELLWTENHILAHDIRRIMQLDRERDLKLYLREDALARGIVATLVMPQPRLNDKVREDIEAYLAKELGAELTDEHQASSEDRKQVRLYYFFASDKGLPDVDLSNMERHVNELSHSWRDVLDEKLKNHKGDLEGKRLSLKYGNSFDRAYAARVSANIAVRDIDYFEALEQSAYQVDLMNSPEDQKASQLKIYHHERSLILSDILPILENLGLRVLEQSSYFNEVEGLSLKGLDVFRVQTSQGQAIDISQQAEGLSQALISLLKGESANDPLNRLVLYSGLSLREIALLQSYRMYYAQISPEISLQFISDTLNNYPQASRLLYLAFEAKLKPHPQTQDDHKEDHLKRLEKLDQLQEAFQDELSKVPSLVADRILRGLMNLIIDASLRSNFFDDKEYISIKLDSQQVTSMPEPRPFQEIAVWHPRVEGIHLRGGMVARGGIRWSDRPDDFRTEVLGLMKTQMTKNAVIVPVGSKGGFVVKQAPSDRQALRSYVETQYQTYIRGLLDLTDNYVGGEIVSPQGLVIYDAPDPYLVVAADKGTATFSDLANGIAAEYHFWLGDAFASGGSYGYDHKKEGITARGAWVCVERHLREQDINVHKDPITVVGIGDMSGDVFGNGLLHRNTLKLLGAFNHQHIFLDPNPDPAASYAERKRLFELPRSTWQDYNPGLISKGGGVFSRFEKSIPLSPQVKNMLDVDEDRLSGLELIKALLGMKVDLLWNGGIGTYVKASNQRHADVGDSSNDMVRIDANQLKAKVIGEGGNLGLSQLARIEYEQLGGRINTDAIDNSGGVDMSDHEVNIKILFQTLLSSGELDFEMRNQLLVQMTDNVSELVLSDNYRQSLALSLAQRRSKQGLEDFERLQNFLSEHIGLKAGVEFLPSRKGYQDRKEQGLGLSRPELAILLAYSKMWLYAELLKHDLKASALAHYLRDYFPKLLQERYPEAINQHPLKQEILATQFSNQVVDILGMDFCQRMMRNTGETPFNIVRASLNAFDILGARELLKDIYALDDRLDYADQIDSDKQYRAIEKLIHAVGRLVPMLLANTITLPDSISRYKDMRQSLAKELLEVLSQRELSLYQQSLDWAKDAKFPEGLHVPIASLDYSPSSITIINVLHQSEAAVNLESVAKSYYQLSDALQFGEIVDTLDGLKPETTWERIDLSGLLVEFYESLEGLVKAHMASGQSLKDFLASKGQALERYQQFAKDIEWPISLASAHVMLRLLREVVKY